VPRARDPKRDEAFNLWKKHNGEVTNRAIAEELDVPEKTISAWKSRDRWNAVLQKNDCSTTNDKPARQSRSPSKEIINEPVVETDELTDKQRLFCIYYVKSFNQTMAAIKAGYAPESAHVRGSELVRNRKVADEIRRIKGKMISELFLDAMDVLQVYVKIAFADITDFVDFGQEKRPELDHNLKPMIDENGDEITYSYSFVNLKNHDEVDGTLITEVKKGKDGVSIKLADKMKALEKLSLYFDLFPDNFKRQLEEEKLKIAHHKVFGVNEEEEYEDDGFEDALQAVTSEVWSNDNSTEEDS
jgi:phage terminase small subunit